MSSPQTCLHSHIARTSVGWSGIRCPQTTNKGVRNSSTSSTNFVPEDRLVALASVPPACRTTPLPHLPTTPVYPEPYTMARYQKSRRTQTQETCTNTSVIMLPGHRTIRIPMSTLASQKSAIDPSLPNMTVVPPEEFGEEFIKTLSSRVAHRLADSGCRTVFVIIWVRVSAICWVPPTHEILLTAILGPRVSFRIREGRHTGYQVRTRRG